MQSPNNTVQCTEYTYIIIFPRLLKAKSKSRVNFQRASKTDLLIEKNFANVRRKMFGRNFQETIKLKYKITGRTKYNTVE